MLALANWLALAAGGDVSLASDPLGSLYLPNSQLLWALQFGSIGLAEAYFLQRRTTYAIRVTDSALAEESRQAKAQAAAADAEAYSAGAAYEAPDLGVDDTYEAFAAAVRGEGAPKAGTLGGAATTTRPGVVPASVASDPGLGDALPDDAPIGTLLPESLSGASFFWEARAPTVGNVRSLLLWMGRVAMVVMAGLALHADGEHGILHDFVQVLCRGW